MEMMQSMLVTRLLARMTALERGQQDLEDMQGSSRPLYPMAPANTL